MTITGIAPVAAMPLQTSAVTALPPAGVAGPAMGTPNVSFAEMLSQGIADTSQKLASADRLVAQFAIDDSVPLHQVTYALEEARLSFELMLQVRNRLLEGAQQLLNMPL